MKKLVLVILIIATVLVYLLKIQNIGLYAGSSIYTSNQENYRYFTAIFAHSNLNHLFSNMIFLIVFGKEVIKFISGIEFLIIYFLTGVLANYASVYYYGITSPNEVIYTLGASGATSGVLGAFVVIYIHEYRKKYKNSNNVGMYFLLVPISMLFGNDSSINYVAHIAGFVVGLIVMKIFLLFRKERYV